MSLPVNFRFYRMLKISDIINIDFFSAMKEEEFVYSYQPRLKSVKYLQGEQWKFFLAKQIIFYRSDRAKCANYEANVQKQSLVRSLFNLDLL